MLLQRRLRCQLGKRSSKGSALFLAIVVNSPRTTPADPSRLPRLTPRAPWPPAPPAPAGYPRFEQCGFFWGQHTDVTLVSAIATPEWSPLKDAAVTAVTWIRRPVDLVLAEFFYSKYEEPSEPRWADRAKAHGNPLKGVSLEEYLESKIFSRCEARSRTWRLSSRLGLGFSAERDAWRCVLSPQLRIRALFLHSPHRLCRAGRWWGPSSRSSRVSPAGPPARRPPRSAASRAATTGRRDPPRPRPQRLSPTPTCLLRLARPGTQPSPLPLRPPPRPQELMDTATWNAGRFAFVGVVEMASESQAVLEAALQIPKGCEIISSPAAEPRFRRSAGAAAMREDRDAPPPPASLRAAGPARCRT